MSLGMTRDAIGKRPGKLGDLAHYVHQHGALPRPIVEIDQHELLPGVGVGVRGNDRAAVERFTREIAPLVLNGPPSVTGFAGGRPKVEEIVAYWPALVDKSVVKTNVEVLS